MKIERSVDNIGIENAMDKADKLLDLLDDWELVFKDASGFQIHNIRRSDNNGCTVEGRISYTRDTAFFVNFGFRLHTGGRIQEKSSTEFNSSLPCYASVEEILRLVCELTEIMRARLEEDTPAGRRV